MYGAVLTINFGLDLSKGRPLTVKICTDTELNITTNVQKE